MAIKRCFKSNTKCVLALLLVKRNVNNPSQLEKSDFEELLYSVKDTHNVINNGSCNVDLWLVKHILVHY